MTHISARLRKLVAERAQYCCEYCLFPQSLTLLSFEMEHIVAEKHGGLNVADNLAFACPYCNRAKGTDLGSIDPLTVRLTAFFNPRLQRWKDHFRLEGAMIIPLTAEGRVTVNILQLNHSDRIAERLNLLG